MYDGGVMGLASFGDTWYVRIISGYLWNYAVQQIMQASFKRNYSILMITSHRFKSMENHISLLPEARKWLFQRKRKLKIKHFPRNAGYYLAARNLSVAHFWIYGLSETWDLSSRNNRNLIKRSEIIFSSWGQSQSIILLNFAHLGLWFCRTLSFFFFNFDLIFREKLSNTQSTYTS